MRNHLVEELVNLAQKDKHIFLLIGDLGFGVLDDFASKFPDRFFNAGISEQNMTAVAAGMALDKNTVYTYSIGNFPGMRCLEQVRNDICYHNSNVKIVVVGGGFAYGQLGMSHHATEDIAIMRALPNMRVYSPADPMEAIEVLRRANEVKGPCYIRLGKGKEPELHPKLVEYDVEKAMELYEGHKVCIIATGSILGEAKKAVEQLHSEGIETGLYNFITIKPIDKEAIKSLATKYDYIITVEEHNIIGGLGGSVAEEMAELPGRKASLIRLGLQDVYTSIVGSQEYLRSYYGMSSEHIIKKVKELLSE